MRKKMKTVPALYPASDEAEEVAVAAPTCHAGIRRRRPELPFSRNWTKRVDSMKRVAAGTMRAKANRKMKTFRVLSPSTDEDADERNDATPTCSIVIRRRGSELNFLGKGSKSVDRMEMVLAAKRVKARRKRKTVSVLSPTTNVDGKEEINTVPSCNSRIRRRRAELPFSQKGERGSVDSIEYAAYAIRVKAKKKTRAVLELSRTIDDEKCKEEVDAVTTCDISITRRRSELPFFKKRIWSVDSMVTAVTELEGENEDLASSICTSHKVKKAFAMASLSSQECRKATMSGRKWKSSSWIPFPSLKKVAWTPPVALGFAKAMNGESVEALGSHQIPITKMTIENNIITGRTKKKLKKSNEMMTMMMGEENTKEEENSSCSNGGISRQSLESFAHMVKAFRYTGNRSLQEPLSCVESDIAATSANATSSATFKGEKASCNCTRVAIGTLEETENRSRLQQSLCSVNIPKTTKHISTTSSTILNELNHNKQTTTFQKRSTIVAVNPLVCSGQQDEALRDLPPSVSKKMKRRHKAEAVHAPCPTLPNELPSQENKKQKKLASFPTNDEVDRVHQSKKCKRRETMTRTEKMQDSYRRVSPDNNWAPPNSPYELLQEDHAFDPWRVLVICMLLNQTTGEQVKKVLRRVFLLCPTAEAAVQVPTNELRTVIESLGLQNKRVRDIQEMSRQYLNDGWTYVTELHGVGKQSLESFARMVKAFRYTGNRSLQEPLSCVESDIPATSANVTSSATFKGEKTSCNCTRVANGTLEETENRSRLQQSLCSFNIPKTTKHISTTFNHNKQTTTFQKRSTIVAVNPLVCSGQQDGALRDLPSSVSKKMKKRHRAETVHAPCPTLPNVLPSQENKKQRKLASFPANDEVDRVHNSIKCKRRETMTRAEKMQDSYRRVSPDNNWAPPNSPYELLQEDHAFDPWRVLVICMLLNQTTGEQVKKVLRRVFLLCPTAEAAVQVPTNELRTVIESLGLQNKRVRDIQEMSRQYLNDGWTYVTELHGVGKYAADAYAIFCVGKPEDVAPEDHKLVKYWEYVVQWKREHYYSFIAC